nr:MAG TPA: hypothetical protein [Caudoviricetes sp.]
MCNLIRYKCFEYSLFRSLFSGKTPGRSCLMMQIYNLYFNHQRFYLLFLA